MGLLVGRGSAAAAPSENAVGVGEVSKERWVGDLAGRLWSREVTSWRSRVSA